MTHPVKLRKKLIEVALPLDEINAASVLEKQPFTRRHPRSIHVWWARRPLAAARAVIFSQLVDDPSGHPELFPTEEAQEQERQRLCRLIGQLVRWENTTNETVLAQAREEIWKSWRGTCADNRDHPQAAELFDPRRLPAFHDPFAGGGALPLEAQRLGLESYASDLNPVAVLINKAMIEIPTRFAGRSPVNREAVNPAARQPQNRQGRLLAEEWPGARGLAEDLRYYGQWLRDQAEERVGHLYPSVEITAEMSQDRPEVKPYVGQRLKVIAWLWARTVRCPNPACGGDLPLLSSFVLSSQKGKEAYLVPAVKGQQVEFDVSRRPASTGGNPKQGMKRGTSGIFQCIFCNTVTTRNYVAAEGAAGRLGQIPTAIVAEGCRERVYLPARSGPELPDLPPVDIAGLEVELSPNPRDVWCRNFGLTTPADLFTPRQLVTLTTFSDLLEDVAALVKKDAADGGLAGDDVNLAEGGAGAAAYAQAVVVYLALANSRWSDLSNSLCSWNSANQNVRALFARQAIPMSWDFVELSPFSNLGPWFSTVEASIAALHQAPTVALGQATQANAADQTISRQKIVSTDPPYYNNVGYADLSDFFYVWLRRSLRGIFPDLFSTMTAPKSEELVAAPYRHGDKQRADAFFLEGMTQAMGCLSRQSHPAFPVTLYYAFKQSEGEKTGAGSTGWEIFLESVLQAGLTISGTLPIRTEREARSTSLGTNSLASSIVLVCRPMTADAPLATRREFVSALNAELPDALLQLQRGNIAPVDLAQAAIGPGMAIFTRYSQVLDASGSSLSVREALALINQTLDQTLAEQEGDFDAESRWALTWFNQSGFAEGEYGVADTLSKAKNTSLAGMAAAGILESRGGKVRLLRPEEILEDSRPRQDRRISHWEVAHQLIRALNRGEAAAADLLARLGSEAEAARELAYRLYLICDRQRWSQEALAYNSLVQSWPQIAALASGLSQNQDNQLEQSAMTL